jgi:hypothetical protein
LEAVESGGQLFNPPHVNSIAAPATERRPYCRMVAAGRGDGAVAVYDADAKVIAVFLKLPSIWVCNDHT